MWGVGAHNLLIDPRQNHTNTRRASTLGGRRGVVAAARRKISCRHRPVRRIETEGERCRGQTGRSMHADREGARREREQGQRVPPPRTPKEHRRARCSVPVLRARPPPPLWPRKPRWAPTPPLSPPPLSPPTRRPPPEGVLPPGPGMAVPPPGGAASAAAAARGRPRRTKKAALRWRSGPCARHAKAHQSKSRVKIR